MTPGARIAAAIEVLDAVLAGRPAEMTLTTWARTHRFAGSGDRAAIRDHVFDAIRCRRSFAALGRAETGRGLMIGALRSAGNDPAEAFTGAGHAPPPLTEDEARPPPSVDQLPENVRLDVPDWLAPRLRASLGKDYARVMETLRHRAPVCVRVNLKKAGQETADEALAADGIRSEPHPLSPTARLVTEGARRLRASRAFLDGLVELQDAASQAVVDAVLPLAPGSRVLDYCAGGGGKALALAAACEAEVFAHDADPGRMADLPARAARAGAAIRILGTAEAAAAAPFDLVLVDAPCSGSGAWRRQPEAKWTLTPDRLSELCRLQGRILDTAATLVGPSGRLAYVTCSMLSDENEAAVTGFLARTPGWLRVAERRFSPLDGGDGFYVATLARDA